MAAKVTLQDVRELLAERPIIVPQVRIRYEYQIDLKSAKPRIFFEDDAAKYKIEFTRNVALLSFAKPPENDADDIEDPKKVAKTVVIAIKDMAKRGEFDSYKLKISPEMGLDQVLSEPIATKIKRDATAGRIIKFN
jgi:hypothetical protein